MAFTFVVSDEYAPRTGPTVRLSSFQTVSHGLFKRICYILVVITVITVIHTAPGDDRKTGPRHQHCKIIGRRSRQEQRGEVY